MMDKLFVNQKNAKRGGRNPAYANVINRIKGDGVCPFCPEHLLKYHKKPILAEGTHWLLTENMYPYKNAKHHLLAIHKKHVEHIKDLKPEAWAELVSSIQNEISKRKIKGGTFYMRFGNTDYTGATVTHLHANVITPDVDNPDRKPILARVG